jgi:predicted ATP-dependent serine protease
MNIAAAEEQYDGEDGNPTFAEIREMFQKTPMSDEEAQEIISAKNSAKKAYQIGLKKWKELNPENGETKPVNNGGIVRKPPTKITGTSGGGKTTLTDESLNNLIDSGKFKDMSKEERWKIMKEL